MFRSPSADLRWQRRRESPSTGLCAVPYGSIKRTTLLRTGAFAQSRGTLRHGAAWTRTDAFGDWRFHNALLATLPGALTNHVARCVRRKHGYWLCGSSTCLLCLAPNASPADCSATPPWPHSGNPNQRVRKRRLATTGISALGGNPPHCGLARAAPPWITRLSFVGNVARGPRQRVGSPCHVRNMGDSCEVRTDALADDRLSPSPSAVSASSSSHGRGTC